MKIAIMGNGNVGSGLAKSLSATSHEVTAYGRDADLRAVLGDADIVILATPYGAAADLAGKADYSGKIVIDVSNPITDDLSGLLVGHQTSAAEEIAKAYSGAKVVKVFKTVFAQHYGRGPFKSLGCISVLLM